MTRRLRLGVVGMLLAWCGSVQATVPVGACFERLHFSDARSGLLLLAVPLEPGDGRFVLAYEHSVHLSTVYSGYQALDGEIVQHWERYKQPGYGMAGHLNRRGGESVRHENGTLEAKLSRTFQRVVIRIQVDRGNRVVAPQAVDLSQRLGNRAVAMTITDRCDSADRSSDGR